MKISKKTIWELTDMLINNPNETQVNLVIGQGQYIKGGKKVGYNIVLTIAEHKKEGEV